jgi:hypothetical protein
MLQRLLVAAILSTNAACAPPSRPALLGQRLEGGDSVGYFVAASDTVVLLVHDPADCLACGTPIGVWRDWERRAPGHALVLVLTRTPTQMEGKAFAAARVTPIGVLETSTLPYLTPAAFLLVHGRTQDSGLGRPGVSALMKRVANVLR